MALTIENHQLLGELFDKAVEQDPCDGKDSGLFTGGRPDTLVIHFTAGPSMASAVNTLKNPQVKASAHLVIDRDGSIKQLVGFDRIAWHAGKSHWKGRRGLNRYAIGIELVNAGELQPSGEQFVSWFGRHYSGDEVIEAVHRNQTRPKLWHSYAEEQIECCFEVCRQLKSSYPIAFILGHEEIAPRRKTDPGPAFPLDRLRDRILVGRDDSAGQPPLPAEPAGNHSAATVTANRLNFRQQPYAGAELAGEPLQRGTHVELVERSGAWCKVRVCNDGWVHGDYLQIEE